MASGGLTRQLWLWVGAVTAAGLLCLGWALTRVSAPESFALPLVMTVLVAVAASGVVRMRTRSQHLITTTAPAVLAAVVVLPAEWAVLCTVVGISASRLVRRQAPPKAVFNVAKETVSATAAAAAAAATVGSVPAAAAASAGPPGWSSALLALGAAALAYAVVDEVLPVPVIALASGIPWQQVSRRDLDVRVVTRLVDFAGAAAAVLLAVVDLRLLVAMPAGLIAMYLLYGYRFRLREERRSWQQLAVATDALAAASGSGDLTRLLHTAADRAAVLFPAVEIEIELDSRLVRGDGQGISYDGPAQRAPTSTGRAVQAALHTGPGAAPTGALRLRLTRAQDIAEREPHLLQTLAAALSTAVRNSGAYATVAELAARNSHEALHDPLTGLPNRRHLYEHTSALLATRGSPVALMLIDLDSFKDVNDSVGHGAGDRVLTEAARRLAAAGGEDVLVARLGGDEFAVVFTTPATPVGAALRAQRILASLRRGGPISLDGLPIHIDGSAGLAVVTGEVETSVEELLRRADVAMYRAKGSDRPVRLAIYVRDHDRAGADRLLLRAEIPRAAGTGDWEIGYRPVIDLATGMVTAAETRACWPHPDLSQLPAGRLLGMIERSGMLPTFTATMLQRALAAAARWREQGIELAVAVDVTVRGLAAPGFADTVRAALAEHRLDARQLILELADAAAVGHARLLDESVAALRAEGVRICLGGVGDSSLAALYQLPIDLIKVDGSLVAAADRSDRAGMLIHAIGGLGQRLAVPVIADGVERDSQRRQLWELGCTHGQGPIFGRAEPEQALLASFERGYADTPGAICPPLHEGAKVIPLPVQRRAV